MKANITSTESSGTHSEGGRSENRVFGRRSDEIRKPRIHPRGVGGKCLTIIIVESPQEVTCDGAKSKATRGTILFDHRRADQCRPVHRAANRAGQVHLGESVLGMQKTLGEIGIETPPRFDGRDPEAVVGDGHVGIEGPRMRRRPRF